MLGPLFFLIFVNDITENLVSISRLFADDISLACTTANVNDLEELLNHDLNIINQWSKQWLVTFNPAKTEVLYFCNSQPPTLNFNNIQLTANSSHKHLGVTLASNGKWSSHIENIVLS